MIKIWKQKSKTLWRTIADEKASAGVIFALASVPALALVGGAVDYMHVLEQRNHVQAALDAGTLAALNLSNLRADSARKVIEKYLRANYANSSHVTLSYADMDVTVVNKTTNNGMKSKQVKASISGKAEMPFLKLIGLGNYSFTVTSEAKVGTGGLEVVLVLDNTGSMAWASSAGGSKMDELKQATKNLLENLEKLSKRPGAETVKVGIVPFSTYVMVNKNAWSKFWLDHNGLSKSEWDGALGVRNPEYDLDITDGKYDTHPVPAVKNGVYQRYRGTWVYVDYDKSTMPVTMLGLQNIKKKKKALENKIDSMRASGWTYIPAGLVWGWRILSHKKPYVKGVRYSTARKRGIKKIIVLMTDGANTCDYYGDGALKCGSGRGNDADQRLQKLCNNIKKKGIGIITVAFSVQDINTENMLQACSNMGFYKPETGQLVQTFNQIGQKLVSLHLSK